MLSDEVRARLAQIHATPPREQAAASSAFGIRSTLSPRLSRPDYPPDLLERGQECSSESGAFLRFRRQLNGFELRQAAPSISIAADAGPDSAKPPTRGRLELEA